MFIITEVQYQVYDKFYSVMFNHITIIYTVLSVQFFIDYILLLRVTFLQIILPGLKV